MSNSSENSTSNEDLQKTLRKLNSCITLKKAVGSSAPASGSESDSFSEGSREVSRSPEGSSGQEDYQNRIDSNIVKDWSKKCISISFAKKDGKSDQKVVENEADSSAKEPSKLSNPEEPSPKADVSAFRCSFCKASFNSQNELVRHILSCKSFGGNISFASNSAKNSSDESEEESSEEEFETSKSTTALQSKSTSSNGNLPKANSKDFLSAFPNLPKGISISSSSLLSKSVSISEPQNPINKPEAQKPISKSEPHINISKSAPQTPISKSEPQTPFSKPEPQNPISKSEPQSSTSKTEPQSSSSKTEPQSSSSKTEPQSSSSKTEPQSSTSKTEPQNSTCNSEPISKPSEILNTDSEEYRKLLLRFAAVDSEEEESFQSGETSDEEWSEKKVPKRNTKTGKSSKSKKSTGPKQITEKARSTTPDSGANTVESENSEQRRESFEFIGFSKNTDQPEKQLVPATSKRKQSVGKKSTAKQFISRKSTLKNVGRKSTAKKSSASYLSCIPCNINDIGSLGEFHRHHNKHIKKSSVVLRRLCDEYYSSDSEQSATEIYSGTPAAENPSSPLSNKSESGSLKLTFKISEVEEPGGHKKRKTVSILNSNTEGMQESLEKRINSPSTETASAVFSQSTNAPNMTAGPIENPLPNSNQFPPNANQAFGNSVPADAPTSAYEPQFESYTGDWLNEYESGERIAAAMTGAGPMPDSGNIILPSGPGHIQEEMYNSNQPLPPPPQSNNPQGGFEQLCLNDSYSQNQSNSTMPGRQAQHLPFDVPGNDIFSDINYLNSAERQANTIGQHSENQFNGSNPSTPSSITSHPSPGDSFRSLAASPQSITSSMSDTISPTPSFSGHGGSSLDTVMPNAPSGQTPPLSMPQESSMEVTTPRLTIANNLMATTTASSLTPLMGVHSQQQWPQSGSNSPSYSQSYSMGPPGTIRPSMPGLPVGYRPSPRPRVRGRPPLMEGMTRSMIRGPGRPPGPTTLNGTRGGTMQRGSSHMYNSGSRMITPQKRPFSGSPNHSPSKSMRREDINVPSRQKDTDCQIIAVANRNEGMPVISNIQGGSQDERARSLSNSAGGDSTIHLSDSITLSVRPNMSPNKTPKGGDAGVVANLLASRGITVTPAAGEKEGGSRDERRLPSASDLNLSSAISVHPPSRDRDGFAVPQPPQSRSSVNDNVERPVRPPTVDLTQEVSPIGSPTTRLQCNQCNRSFPSQSLLADHAKVHQSQLQSRMPYKCHLCNAGFSAQKGQQTHYQQFHQLQLSASDLAIPLVDVRNPVTQRKMQQLGVRAFLPLTNLQNRGAGGVVGIPILTLENINNGQMSLQQWGITDVMSLGPPKTFNSPRPAQSPMQPRMQRPPMS